MRISTKFRNRFSNLQTETFRVFEERRVESKSESSKFAYFEINPVEGSVEYRTQNVARRNYSNELIQTNGQIIVKFSKGTKITDKNVLLFGGLYYSIRADFSAKENSVFDRFLAEKLSHEIPLV